MSEQTNMTETERNKQLARDYIDASTRGDAAAIQELFHEDCVFIVPGTTPISRSYTKADMFKAAAGVFAPFPEGLKFEVVSIIAEGDRVAMESKSYGKHVCGEIYANEYHWVMQFRDGKIIYGKEYLDTQLVADVLCAPASDSEASAQ